MGCAVSIPRATGAHDRDEQRSGLHRDHGVSEQAIGKGFYHFTTDQARTPGGGNVSDYVVSAGELPLTGGDNVRVDAQIHLLQGAIAEVVGGLECPYSGI